MKRYDYLEKNRDFNARLTKEEQDEGYHYCPDHGWTLIGPGMDWELLMCECDIPVLEGEKRSLKHE